MMRVRLAFIALLGVSSLQHGIAASPHQVTTAGNPPAVFEIDAAYRALPPITFPIANLTQATRHVFVKPDPKGIIMSTVIVQFETVNAGSDFRFLFPAMPPEKFGEHTYRFTSFVYDDERAARQSADREPGRTRALLRSKGLTPPTRWKGARLARVSDPDGLSEVIIFYFENADTDPPIVLGDDGYQTLPTQESTRLLQRLRDLVRPVRR